MTTPADWALIKAHDILWPEYESWPNKKKIAKVADTQHNLAAYIEANEQPPFDPLVLEAQELLAQLYDALASTVTAAEIRSGDWDKNASDLSYEMGLVMAALRRGIELGKEDSE